MVEMFNKAENEMLYTDNKVKIFNDGVEKFAALFEDLRKAKHTIYVQYYIFKSDGLSTEFMDILKSKAKEGLDVYLLVDGMGVRKMKLRDRKSLEKLELSLPSSSQVLLTRSTLTSTTETTERLL